MSLFRMTRIVSLALALVVVSLRCAGTQDRKPPESEKAPIESQPQFTDMSIDQLRQEIRTYLEEQLREQNTQKRADGNGTKSKAQRRGEPLSPDALKQHARELLRQLRTRVQADLMVRIEQEFGVPAEPKLEPIPLEAVDQKGDAVMIDVPVETRELRRLTLPANRARTYAVVGDEDLTLALYTDVPTSIAPVDTAAFVRHYESDGAAAIAMETRLIVTLKGGDWVQANGGKRVANAVAIRGLDLANGLHENSNKRYDDTMFVVLEDSNGDFEVYEYRMTTESSSEEKGVGRLDSKQVTYVRGLHRGEDPGYCLKGGSADGTRVDMEGAYKIAGANIHSAYAKRVITSDTPLKENVSLGCQVVAAGKTPFEKSLVFTLDDKGVTEFPYTIVDEEEMALLDEALQEKGKQSVLVRAIARGQ